MLSGVRAGKLLLVLLNMHPVHHLHLLHHIGCHVSCSMCQLCSWDLLLWDWSDHVLLVQHRHLLQHLHKLYSCPASSHVDGNLVELPIQLN